MQTRTWTDDQGRRFTFAPDGSGGYLTPAGLHGTLSETVSGYTYREKDGMIHEFDADGKLVELRDRNGNSITIAYDASGHPILTKSHTRRFWLLSL